MKRTCRPLFFFIFPLLAFRIFFEWSRAIACYLVSFFFLLSVPVVTFLASLARSVQLEVSFIRT